MSKSNLSQNSHFSNIKFMVISGQKVRFWLFALVRTHETFLRGFPTTVTQTVWFLDSAEIVPSSEY